MTASGGISGGNIQASGGPKEMPGETLSPWETITRPQTFGRLRRNGPRLAPAKGALELAGRFPKTLASYGHAVDFIADRLGSRGVN
jgi:hypothetical protein